MEGCRFLASTNGESQGRYHESTLAAPLAIDADDGTTGSLFLIAFRARNLARRNRLRATRMG